jgi:phosphatidylglycerol:prolipoprotein diacylglycerol transferase
VATPNAFWQWWQHLPEKMDPVIFQIGSFRLQYYGLMYIVAFAITYVLIFYRLKKEDRFRISADQVQGLMTAMILGLIVGARFGYVLFYNLSYYLKQPWEIILPFDFSDGMHFIGITGMSYHGGLIGAVIGAGMFIRKNRLDFWSMADLVIPTVPLGYTFGRLGNFINGELFGRPTDAVFGMYFPQAQDPFLRHPSQLYEAFFEGIILFLILWSLRRVMKTKGSLLALYLIGYGLVRFFIEYARQPDAQLGFVLFSFSMGQVLCATMILCGLVLWAWLNRRGKDRASKSSSS